ncbi:RND family transporter [Bowmanella sp. JS7-9]|uniref:RND family transporter n=1 Tax=Pseudobowmanella zhangzhouensis TaxID=1537679 RepID=A0ABW1XSC2_9ALTE|nr:MMPL family transporter [Bowmanella sp. JS7-9]TBX24443.1 RND transporter [Bowmanella sp. JS7-9]
MEKLIENWALRRSWVTLILSVLLTVVAAWGASQLYFRGDYKVFFGAENPQLRDFESMQATFNKSDNVGIVIAPKQDSVFSERMLELVWRMTEDAWQTPYSSRVDSVTNFQFTEAIDDDLLVAPLLEFTEDLSPEKVEKIRTIALHEPSLVNKLISEDGRVTMINITVQQSDDDQLKTAQSAEIVTFVRDLVARYDLQYAGVEFHLTGVVMVNNGFFEEANKDASTLLPAMFIAVILMLVILLRSFTATTGTVLVIIMSIAVTLGIAGWLGYYLSTATVNVPIIVMTLAVADCVHMGSGVLFNMRNGMHKNDAIAASLALNFKPIFITSATTAIGFLTFNFSDVPPLRDLGNLTAIGVILAWWLSITIFPAFLRVLPLNPPAVAEGKQPMMNRFAEWNIRNRGWLLPVSSAVIVGFTVLMPFNSINDVAIEYFDEDVALRQDADFMQQYLTGFTTVDIALETGEASGVNSPLFLQKLESFSSWLRAQPEVDHVFTLADVYKRLNRNMHNDDNDFYRLPKEQDLAAQYLLLYEMSLPYGLDLNNQLNLNKSAVKLSVTLHENGSKEMVAFEQRVRSWLARYYPEVNVSVAGVGLMFAHIGERNMTSMLWGTAWAIVMISGLLMIALKDVRLGLISLIPNLAPAGIGFGVWAVYNGNVNLGLSVVTSMCLGIVVDDTVHFLSKYKHARQAGKDAEQAVRYAFISVGKALWVTTLVLITGFMLLSLSDFNLNSDLGLLTAAIIAIALLVDFFFLPAFLMLVDKGETYQEVKDAN